MRSRARKRQRRKAGAFRYGVRTLTIYNEMQPAVSGRLNTILSLIPAQDPVRISPPRTAAVWLAHLRRLKRQPLNEAERLQALRGDAAGCTTSRVSQFKDKNSGG